MKSSKILFLLVLICHGGASTGADIARVIASVKPSIVGIGSLQKLRSPAIIFFGTGFVVGDGLTVLTSAHVLQGIGDINSDKRDTLGILIGMGETAQFRAATVIALDKEHDLAQLHFGGTPLPAMQLGDSGNVAEGQTMAFTGFPLGMVLGLHHVTHRAMVSSITPVAMPSINSRELGAKLIGKLHQPAYAVFQLDGTAYPGNSGSPLYDPETGLVYGVINMVYVRGLKENAVSNPSGITYAIPGNFIRDMLHGK